MPKVPGWYGDGAGGLSVTCQVWRELEGGRATVQPGGGSWLISPNSCDPSVLARR